VDRLRGEEFNADVEAWLKDPCKLEEKIWRENEKKVRQQEQREQHPAKTPPRYKIF